MWILVQPGFELPIVASTEQEAMDLLEKFNNDHCDGEATIKSSTGTYNGSSMVDVRSICVIDVELGFDEESPLAVAYEYSYDNQVW